MRLYWTDDVPDSGWAILKLDDGTFRAEEVDGPRALTATTLPALVIALMGDDTALARRYSETQVRTVASSLGYDPNALATALRALQTP